MPEVALALHGGAPVRLEPFPASTVVPAAEPDAIAAFEAALSSLIGGRPVVACAGFEEALSLGLRLAAPAAPGPVEVVVPTLGGAAAARAALALGMGVVPVDVDQDTGNLSARALAASVGEHTRLVVVPHRFGHPATMPDIMRIAQHYNLVVIEDLVESLGAAVGGEPVGTFGDIAVLGGGSSHLVTTPGIGAVAPRGAEQEATLRSWSGDAPPTEEEARRALGALRNGDDELHARRQAAWHLTYELRQVRGVSPMYHGRRVRHAYDCYVIRLRSVLWNRSLEETAAALTAEGVPASVAVGPMVHEDADVVARLGDDPRIQPDRFNVARQLASELIAIPLSGALTSRDMDDVAAAIRKVAAASQRVDVQA